MIIYILWFAYFETKLQKSQNLYWNNALLAHSKGNGDVTFYENFGIMKIFGVNLSYHKHLKSYAQKIPIKHKIALLKNHT